MAELLEDNRSDALTTPRLLADQSPRSVVNENGFIDVGRFNYLLGIVTRLSIDVVVAVVVFVIFNVVS